MFWQKLLLRVTGRWLVCTFHMWALVQTAMQYTNDEWSIAYNAVWNRRIGHEAGSAGTATGAAIRAATESESPLRLETAQRRVLEQEPLLFALV